MSDIREPQCKLEMAQRVLLESIQAEMSFRRRGGGGEVLLLSL